MSPADRLGTADFTILRDGRLIAYLWIMSPGTFKSIRKDAPTTEIPFAEIESFDQKSEEFLLGLVKRSRDLDGFLFKLKLEECQVERGAVQPSHHRRRF